MKYTRLNTIIGWIVFAIATAVYFLTLESTVSLWDCGEYIMAAYKLEVGHPPGAPLFMLLGRMFTFFISDSNLGDVAVWINRMSALSSSFTILFMYWSITLLIKKMVLDGRKTDEITKGEMIAIFGSGAVGALAYTFSETFWFSAVEGEVYAMASLFTAIVFWAILKWDEEMAFVQNGQLSGEHFPNRWLLLIMFLIGLAIGVHLLGILLVPAIAFMIYFRVDGPKNLKTFLLTGIGSVIVLGVIQEVIIPGTVSMASKFEVFFRNSIGLPFNFGTIFFFIALIVLLIVGLKWSKKNGKTILYNSIFGLALLFIGYGSFAVIVIRSNADTPMDQNNPENLVNLHTYLTREQYGSTPLLTGPYWNSKENGGRFDGTRWEAYADKSLWKDRKAQYVRRWMVVKNDQIVATYLAEKDANAFAGKNGGEVKESFYEVNAEYRKNVVPTYSQTTLFPRMYDSDMAHKVDGYKRWSGYDDQKDGERGKDNLPLPNMAENLSYFFNYQMDWMYMRYLLWNFAGRQNDIQGHGDDMRGNWKSGLSFIDTPRLGDQADAPFYTTNNPANNSFFFIPLILTIIGLIFHIRKAPKDAFVVFLGFLLTGIAIVVYLNQKTFEPRERDYAYAGSFYFLMMWLGMGVFALYQAFAGWVKNDRMQYIKIAGAGLALFLLMDLIGGEGMTKTFSWLWISLVGGAALLIMSLFKKVSSSQVAGASLATMLGLSAPIILGMQGWDDHDRNGKTTAHDVAYNYLVNLSKNSVIFTNGDNDTFPLWYIQEVEKFRTDVRVVNTSLLQTDWYTAQMMRRVYDSSPLPIGFTPDQILMYTGGTDQVLISTLSDLYMRNMYSNEQYKKLIEMRIKSNSKEAVLKAIATTQASYTMGLSSLRATNAAMQPKVTALKDAVVRPVNEADLVNDLHVRFAAMKELVNLFRSREIEGTQQAAEALQGALESLEKGWDAMDAKEAMAFLYNDANKGMIDGNSYRVIPSNNLRLKVNKDNLIKSGVATESERSKIMDYIDVNIKASSLTREELVMLDVIVSSDFARGVYFSNPYGAQISRAFYDAGAVKQTGSNYVVKPVKTDVPFDVDVFYDVIMNKSHYGNMKDPKVLTDYYARRHTVQYRQQFASLAKYYVQKVEMADRALTYPAEYLESLKERGDVDNYNRISEMRKDHATITKEAKEHVIKLLNKSLEVMPASVVIDGGEPQQSAVIEAGGGRYPRYSDGLLVDYVQLYYAVGANAEAEKLGNELAAHYEQAIYFFLNAPMRVTLNEGNHKDFFAALDMYFQLTAAANDGEIVASSKLAKRTMGFVDQLLGKLIPDMFSRLDSAVLDAGSKSEKYQWALYTLKDYIQVLAADYGLVESKEGPSTTTDTVDFNQLMNEQNKKDSVVQP